MYYAIHNGQRFIDTAFNCTSTFEVREQLVASIEKRIDRKAALAVAGEPLDNILDQMGLKLHKQETPFEKTKKFRIIAAVTTYCYLYVNADTENEARQIAETTDSGDFYTMDEDERPGSFVIENVELIS